MSYTVTVINRTGKQTYVGIDPAYGATSPNSIYGRLANGVLNPGVTSGFVISGSAGPYQVGYLTVLSGHSQAGSYHSGVVVYDVFPNSIVTVATEVGTRPSPEAKE
jgi:hypothetical protein